MSTRMSVLALVAVLNAAGPVLADEIVDGRTASGALYRLVKPTVWNGSLVLYAHGFVSPGAPVALPGEGDLITGLLVPQGFAVAFSSYSENGWAVRDGAERTHQLQRIFAQRFTEPARVYLAGASMGGLIVIKLAEEHPNTYAGALPACAAAGGSRAQFDYLAHVRAVFDYFYPNVLPGNAARMPGSLDVTHDIVEPATSAMALNPAGAFAIASVQQTPIPFASPEELIQSIVTALAFHADSMNDLIEKSAGHSVFDNRRTWYDGHLPVSVLRDLNLGIERFRASPSGLEFLERFYEPTGELHMPMVMLSSSRDPVVPGFHQASYGRSVALERQSKYLVQEQIDRYGHCVFTPDELGKAFADLVGWVEFGLKPTP